ncbi:cation:proton antiporter [Thermogemmatispora sp.]|uniref:cation:proton antiporter domain-containing protein n=1 Tax=Thermogemmatispora sp. TaxID=1968838 RepID=UPI001E0AFC62|nr:cation:proton antiporter [Thermogemmatispora sp.]MBX5450849.1 cation:proton antiporter [Thermogemmatispora sp.]
MTETLLLQLVVMVAAVQLCGLAGQRLGLQRVIGEIVAGLLLGPSFLGRLAPALEHWLFPSSSLPMLQTLGDLGLIVYLFALGAQLDVELAWRQSGRVLLVSLVSMLLPFGGGAVLAWPFWPTLAGPQARLPTFALLLGTALAITAFPVLARLLSERGLQRTPLGMVALLCAAVDDVLAWCLLALTLALTRVSSSLLTVALTVGLTLLFTLAALFLLRPALAWLEQRREASSFLTPLTLLLLLLGAYFTGAIGVHPLFGAFVMGLCLPRKPAFLGAPLALQEINSLLLLPLYFVASGLRTRLDLLTEGRLWLLMGLWLLVACAGKLLGGSLAARWTRLASSWREALALGALLNARGLVELIILNVGLEAGLLSPQLFTMGVLMALTTTIMACWLLPLTGLTRQEETEAGTLLAVGQGSALDERHDFPEHGS